MANRYWVGSSGNWSSTSQWSTSSGGASGASVPTSADNAIFDANSNATAYTVTIDAAANCADLNFSHAPSSSGTITWAGSQTMNVYGSVTLLAGMTRTFTGTINLLATSAKTITNAGVSFGGPLIVNGAAGSWTLQDSLVNSDRLDLQQGTFDANGFNVTCAAFWTDQATTTRQVNMGAGTWSLTGTALTNSHRVWAAQIATGLTINASTSTIKITDAGFSEKIFDGGGKTYYKLWFATGTDFRILGANTFTDLKATSGAVIEFGANQTVSGATLNGAAPASTDIPFAYNQALALNYFSTPSAAANQITGDIDIRGRVDTASFITGTNSIILSKRQSGQDAYRLLINASAMTLIWWDSGGNTRSCSSDALPGGLTSASMPWVRVTLQVDNGSGGHVVTFYYSLDYNPATETGTWTQIGATKNAGAFTTSIKSTTAPLEVGCENQGSTTFDGRIYRVRLYSGIAGTLKADWDPSLYTPGQSTWVSATGETWTRQGNMVMGKTNAISLTSSSNGTPTTWTITKSGGGIVACDYLMLFNSTGSPGSTWYAGAHSSDCGSNSGWSFTTPYIDSAAAKSRAVPINAHDDATLTESPAMVSTRPSTNTQLVARDKTARSTSTATQRIQGTFGGDTRLVNAIFIFRDNAHGGKVRFLGYANSDFTGCVMDTGALDRFTAITSDGYQWGVGSSAFNANDLLGNESPYWLFFTQALSLKSYEFVFSNAPATISYWEVGRFFVGKYLEAPYSPDYGMELSWKSNDSQQRTYGGSLYTTGRSAKWREVRIDMVYYSDAQRALWRDFLGQVTVRKDVAWALRPGVGGREERDTVLDAQFSDLAPFNWANVNQYRTVYTFVEV